MEVIQEFPCFKVTIERCFDLLNCWNAYLHLQRTLTSALDNESDFEAALFLHYIAAVVMTRFLIDGAPAEEPPIVTVADGYEALSKSFPCTLFEPGLSGSEQLGRLAENLKSVAQRFDLIR
jgi:hypothetical protein